MSSSPALFVQHPHSMKTLEAAASVEEIVAAVQGFLQGLTTQRMDRLPRSNRPANVNNAQGVEHWAERLARYQPPPTQDPVNSALLIEVRDYFALAASRLSDISRPGGP